MLHLAVWRRLRPDVPDGREWRGERFASFLLLPAAIKGSGLYEGYVVERRGRKPSEK